jgi:hypothetical protein
MLELRRSLIWRRLSLHAIALLALSASACTLAEGAFGAKRERVGKNGRSDTGGDSNSNVGTGASGTGASGGTNGSGNGGDVVAPVDALTDSTRFPRLTHTQWENSVRDLLKLSAVPGLSSAFTTDPPGSTFGNNGELLQVTPGLSGDYARAASTLAKKVAGDPASLARLFPRKGAGTSDDRMRNLLRDFGLRAYRRPLEDAEVDSLLALWKNGTALTDTTDAFAAGAEVVIQVALQSPYFVYRTEFGSPGADGVLYLSNYELASRLSYSLWNTMPDDSLMEAARNGVLVKAEGLLETATRMLDDARAEPLLREFHAKLFHLDRVDGLKKSVMSFPEWSDDLPGLVRKESELFVD